MTLDSVVAGALGGTASGVIVAWVNHLFSRRQFVSERWWERKAEAYSDVMEHLGRLQAAVVACILELEESEPEQEAWDKYVGRWDQAADALGSLALQETFLISMKARTSLALLSTALATVTVDESDALPRLKEFGLAVRKCTEDVARFAHEDLGVHRE